jgi:hypothetical protein
MTHVLRFELSGERKQVRDSLVYKFLEEPQGSGDYKYIVESTPDGDVELIRPTRLNKGVDFAIQLSGFEFRNRRSNGHKLPIGIRGRPTHDDIYYLLNAFKGSAGYKIIQNAIHEIYALNHTDYGVLDQFKFHHDIAQKEISAHSTCALIKWLFIEQDITYWTGLGRDMLYGALKERGLL